MLEGKLAVLRANRTQKDDKSSEGQAVTTAADDLKASGARDSKVDAQQSIKPADAQAAGIIIGDHPVKSEPADPPEHEGAAFSEKSAHVDVSGLKKEEKPDGLNTVSLSRDSEQTAGIKSNAAANQARPLERTDNVPSANKNVPPILEDGLDVKNMIVESAFGDQPGNETNNDLDFAMEFSNGGENAQALMGDDPFAIETSNITATSVPAATTDDIDSLLPGLESFANAADDFSMADLQPTSISNQIPATAAPKAVAATTTMADVPNDLLPPQSNFDDMFFDSGEFTMDQGGGAGDAGDDVFGEIGDFDESWFKTDGS